MAEVGVADGLPPELRHAQAQIQTAVLMIGTAWPSVQVMRQGTARLQEQFPDHPLWGQPEIVAMLATCEVLEQAYRGLKRVAGLSQQAQAERAEEARRGG